MKEDLIEKIETYYLGYEPIVSILKALASGVAGVYDSYEGYQASIDANPDSPALGFISQDDVLTGEADIVLLRIPGRGIGQLAIDFKTDERV